MNSQFDVVIMGAGMVGASLVSALLNHAKTLDLKIALIEPQASPYQAGHNYEHLNDYQSSFDARSTALSHSSREIFEILGLWETLNTRLADIRDVHVSDRGHIGSTRLRAEEQSLPALGYVEPYTSSRPQYTLGLTLQ